MIWGNPGGSGNWNGEGMGREWGGGGHLRATWGQGGRDRTTQEEGFQVSKRDLKKGGNWQGELARETSKGNNEGLRHSLAFLICVCVS